MFAGTTIGGAIRAFTQCAERVTHRAPVRLSAPVALAVQQSGVLQMGGDFAWLKDKRIVAALQMAH